MMKSLIIPLLASLALLMTSCFDNCKWVECPCCEGIYSEDCCCCLGDGGHWDCSEEDDEDVQNDNRADIQINTLDGRISPIPFTDNLAPHIFYCSIINDDRLNIAEDIKCKLTVSSLQNNQVFTYHKNFDIIYPLSSKEWEISKKIYFHLNEQITLTLEVDWVNENGTTDFATYTSTYFPY